MDNSTKSQKIKKKIGKLFTRLSSRVSSIFYNYDAPVKRIESVDKSAFVSSPESLSYPIYHSFQDLFVSSRSFNFLGLQSSSSAHLATCSDETIVANEIYSSSQNIAMSDPCISDGYIMSGTSPKIISTEISKTKLPSIDEITPIVSLDQMNLQFSVLPLAIQPENVERAKRSKSAKSRKSLKSAPSLADMKEDISDWTQKKTSELSLTEEINLEKVKACPQALGPKELRSLIQSLKLEEKNQKLEGKKTRVEKVKKLAWSEMEIQRFRSRSDERFDLSKSGSKNSISKQSTPSLKETSTIFVKDESATFVNSFGEQECSTAQINQYHIIREIGCGSFGTVYLCKTSSNGQYYALKVLSKSRLMKKMRWKAFMPGHQHDFSEEMRREIAVLKKLSHHPNINQLVEVLENTVEDNIYMIFDLCEYGPIMKLVPNQTVTPYSEEMARRMLRDVLLGLEYSKLPMTYEEDIKPENLLFSQDFSVVIADFGISHTFENEYAAVEDQNGSPIFSPPEAFQGVAIPDGRSADVWSLGVTLYALVHGRTPFYRDNIVELSDLIKNQEIEYSPNLSELLVDLLSGMLKKDPDDRLTIQEIKVHPWVTLRGSDSMISTEENCIYEEVTAEEVKMAFRPAVKFATRLMNSLRRRLSTRHSQRCDKPSID